jgi:hypothetical protein
VTFIPAVLAERKGSVHEGDLASKSFEVGDQGVASLIIFLGLFHQAKEPAVINVHRLPALGAHLKRRREMIGEKTGFF